MKSLKIYEKHHLIDRLQFRFADLK